jgi:hypothetical protein
MTKDEALDLALEALEESQTDNDTMEFWDRKTKAITAIKQARALDKKAENARELGLDYEPVWNNLPSNKDVEDAMRMKRLNQLVTPPAAQPAVPDAIHHTDLSEHPQYIEGWNDCRAEMLKGMK